MILKQSTSRNVPVLLVESSDHVTGLTGATLTITASKDGGAFASISPTVTELANGWYSVALTSTHTNTLGALALHITATSADPTDVLYEVVADLPGASVSSVTGAVGSVTGNVGGSVASVTGAVGSVTGNVGGNVAGSVASVTAGVTVSTNNDKTGYSLSSAGVQAIWDALTSALTTVGSIGKLLVSNIDAAISSRLASASYTAPDNATIATINSNVDVAVSTRATPAQILTTALTESYSTKGGTLTLSQALFELVAASDNRAVSSTTETIYKRDGSTAAKTLTLNDATSPTSTTRAT